MPTPYEESIPRFVVVTLIVVLLVSATVVSLLLFRRHRKISKEEYAKITQETHAGQTLVYYYAYLLCVLQVALRLFEFFMRITP